MRADILDYFDLITATGFDVPAQEAIDRFKAKGLKTSFSYADVTAEENQAAFTIAKMMDVDLVADVKASLDAAIEAGTSFRDWADQIIPMLQGKGWWGRQAVKDPLTGQTIIAALGSPHRLQTIFRTNMASAYANGHWDQIEAQAEDAPYLLYDAIDDYRTRPEHAAWDNTVLPITNRWWRTHTPPCGFNCRCSVIQLDENDLEAFGLEVDKRAPPTKYEDWQNPRTGKTEKVVAGIDPGFGEAQAKRLDRLKKLLGEKIAALPPEMEKAAKSEPKPRPTKEPEKPQPKYKTFKPLKNVKEAEQWILKNIAVTTGLPKSTKISGLNEIARATLEVNERFDLPPVRYIGDKNNDVNRYRIGARATAAYAPNTDAFLLTARGTDDAAMKTRFSGASGGYNQKVLLDILGSPRFSPSAVSPVKQLVETELKDGIKWSIVEDSRSLTMHEMGHRLHQFNRQKLDELGSQALSEGWPALMSRYGMTNRSEYIAEAFALYMKGDEKQFWRIFPPMLDWFRKIDKSGEL